LFDVEEQEVGGGEQFDRHQAPRRGNTIYVNARGGVTEQLLLSAFTGIGNIINISVEAEKR